MVRNTLGFLLLAASTALLSSGASGRGLTAQAEEDTHFAYEVMPQASAALGTLGTPSAFMRPLGSPALGLLFQGRTRAGSASDGAATVTFTLLQQSRVAAAVALNVLSLGVHEPIAKRMSCSVRLSSRLSTNTYLGFGLRNALAVGGSDAPSQVYLVLSTAPPAAPDQRRTRAPAITLGLGYLYTTSAQRPYQDVAQEVASRYGPFVWLASVRVDLRPGVGGFVEWTGEDLNAGLVIAVGRSGAVVAPTLADLTHRAPNGPRFVVGFGLPLNL